MRDFRFRFDSDWFVRVGGCSFGTRVSVRLFGWERARHTHAHKHTWHAYQTRVWSDSIYVYRTEERKKKGERNRLIYSNRSSWWWFCCVAKIVEGAKKIVNRMEEQVQMNVWKLKTKSWVRSWVSGWVHTPAMLHGDMMDWAEHWNIHRNSVGWKWGLPSRRGEKFVRWWFCCE